MEVARAPTAGAERSTPRPTGPVPRMSRAYTGKSAVAPPRSTAKRSRDMVLRSTRRLQMKPTPEKTVASVTGSRVRATRVKMLDRLCQPPMLPRARPATPAAFTTSHTITTRRRSQRSATCPTTKVRSTMGTNCTRPTRPRSRALPVRLYSCHPTATPSIWKPTLARTREEERKANGGWRRSDRDDEGISTPLAVGAGEHRVQQDIDARRGVVELGVLRFVVRDTVSARREDHGGGSHPRDVVRVVSRLAQDVPMGHAEHLRGLADEAHA